MRGKVLFRTCKAIYTLFTYAGGGVTGVLLFFKKGLIVITGAEMIDLNHNSDMKATKTENRLRIMFLWTHDTLKAAIQKANAGIFGDFGYVVEDEILRRYQS